MIALLPILCQQSFLSWGLWGEYKTTQSNMGSWLPAKESDWTLRAAWPSWMAWSIDELKIWVGYWKAEELWEVGPNEAVVAGILPWFLLLILPLLPVHYEVSGLCHRLLLSRCFLFHKPESTDPRTLSWCQRNCERREWKDTCLPCAVLGLTPALWVWGKVVHCPGDICQIMLSSVEATTICVLVSFPSTQDSSVDSIRVLFGLSTPHWKHTFLLLYDVLLSYYYLLPCFSSKSYLIF